MKTVYCLRGLPGMGKTTVAKALCHGRQESSVIVSADDYFCWRNFLAYLNRPEMFTIVIDNTNIRRKDFSNYRRAAINTGCRWIEMTIGDFDADSAMRRNTHGVPLEKIIRWKAEFER